MWILGCSRRCGFMLSRLVDGIQPLSLCYSGFSVQNWWFLEQYHRLKVWEAALHTQRLVTLQRRFFLSPPRLRLLHLSPGFSFHSPPVCFHPFMLGWAFQALSGLFKFLTRAGKKQRGWRESPWSEIEGIFPMKCCSVTWKRLRPLCFLMLLAPFSQMLDSTHASSSTGRDTKPRWVELNLLL